MLGLTNPLFLAGLLLVGLPIFIHFLTRPRPRLIRYPTFHLLMEAGSGRQALHRLRTWVVLFLRTLAVLALVFLFSRPFLRAERAVGGSDGTGERVAILLDASMSMGAVQGGVPLFARAKAQAAELLRNLTPDTMVSVILIGHRPVELLPALSRNHSGLHERLTQAKSTLEKGEPGKAVALAHRLLQGNGKVYVLSDFQRSDWAAVDFTRYSGLSFFLRPIGQGARDNVGIIAVTKSPNVPVAGETFELSATVFNSSPNRRTENLHFELEGLCQRPGADPDHQ
jgi:hypothetical protein